jgi:hypothetical protein
MKKNSSLLALEIVWISTGLICFFTSIRLIATTGGWKSIIFAVMALISFAFAWIRHSMRKKG